MDAAQHIGKANRLLAGGRHMLAGGFNEAAGREAYLAAFHAALAYILVETGKRPKTHSGTRSEFARLARLDPRISSAHASFLASACELKTMADYDQATPDITDDC